MIEHLFLADVLRHMWYKRREVVEVAKAQVDSWGYDVVLACGAKTRHVQLKTSLPVDVNERLGVRPGGCVVAALPGPNAERLEYRFWDATRGFEAFRLTRSTVYKRGQDAKAEKPGHRRVPNSQFGHRQDVAGLCAILFPDGATLGMSL